MTPTFDRWRSRAALAGMTAVALLAVDGLAVAAPTAPSASRVVRFTAPADDALVRSKLVPVRIKVGSRVKAVKVFADNRDVTRRFTRHGRAYTAKLPRSLFKSGTSKLLVQAQGGGAASVSIIVPRTAKNLMLRAVSGPKASSLLSAGPPGTVSYQPTRGQVPVSVRTKTATFSRLTVNGRRVHDLRANRARPTHDWLVSVRDGLKVGRNRIAVETWDRRGRYAVKRWTVERDRSRPLAEAGPRERVVEPKRWVQLDGSRTKATRKGAELGYAWRVVRAPKGAKPRLRNANAATPRFTTDKPGVYQVALRATQTGGRGRASVRAAAPAASTAAEDVITLDAVPGLGTQGLYVNTGLYGRTVPAQAPYRAMWLYGESYGAGSDDEHPNTFVQLDETTLVVHNAGTYDQMQPQAGMITIGTWGNVSLPFTPYSSGSAVWIGTQMVALNGTNDTFSSNGGNPTSNLHGWLTPPSSIQNGTTWVDSDMLPVKTRLPTDTATTNTIEVGGQSYPQSLPAGAQGGYHLLELDNAGSPKWNQIYGMTGDAAADAHTLDVLAWDINNATANTTFLLQGFGTLSAIPANDNLANTLQRIGGRADVVDRFNGTADGSGGVYALIAGPSPTAKQSWSTFASTEASAERTGTGTLSGLLVRDAQANNYIPMTSDSGAPDPAGSSRYALLPLAYQAPADWSTWIRNGSNPLRAPTAAESAAYADLLAQVQANQWVAAPVPCPAAPDAIRSYYCTTDADLLETFLTRVSSQLPFNATTAGGRYTATDWGTVRGSIEDEIGDIADIRAAIGFFQNPFATSSAAGAAQAPVIANQIKTAIKQSTSVTTNARLDAVVNALTDMASIVPEIGPAMTFMSGTFALDSTLEPGGTSSAILDTESVTQDTAAATLVTALQSASESLSSQGDWLASDPVKIQQGAIHLRNIPQTTPSEDTLQRAVEYGVQQWLWGTLLAPAYTTWVLPTALGTDAYCVDKQGTSGGFPFANAGQSGVWSSAIGIGGANSTSNWLLAIDTQAANSWGWAVPNGSGGLDEVGLPASITDKLFGPISSADPPSTSVNAGAVMPYFALRYLPFKWPTIAPQKQWKSAPAPIGCQPRG